MPSAALANPNPLSSGLLPSLPKFTRPSGGSTPVVCVPTFCTFRLSCVWRPNLNVCGPASFVRLNAQSWVRCQQRNPL